MRKVRASQDGIAGGDPRASATERYRRRFPAVRVERCGKSAPECRRLYCYVNLIRCNVYWYTLPQHWSGGQRRNGGLSCEVTHRPDKLSHTTELGLQVWSWRQRSVNTALSLYLQYFFENQFIKNSCIDCSGRESRCRNQKRQNVRIRCV